MQNEEESKMELNELHEIQTETNSAENEQEMEVLQAISCCISEMS
jgi:hypothetical protein